MDRIEHPPRRRAPPSEPEKRKRASPWIMLLVLGGVGLFVLLLGPVMKPRAPGPRVQNTISGEVQPTWQRTPALAPSSALADAGAR